ncbi:MAG TPA: RnfABCDGE type electron transport complex subunit C [Verrucomicrobiae bacterium]|jgi:electron transport complex protein RnfC|nr:RnfABCDGE type electron transport complex subunit C [Verrucomicrobiae bacterium]
MRGVKIPARNQSTLISWTLKRIKAPSRVRLFLKPSPDYPASIPCVNPGDRVLAGQKIAGAGQGAFPIFSSVSGKVVQRADFQHPWLGSRPALEIAGDDRHETAPGIGHERPRWPELDPGALADILFESGVMELDQSGLSLSGSLERARRHKIHTVVVNGCESQPYVTTDHALLMSHSLEVVKGAEILRKILGAEKIIVTLQSDALEVAELVKSKIFFLKWAHAEVRVLPARHPQEMVLPLAQELWNKDFSPQVRERIRIGTGDGTFALQSVLHEFGASVHNAGTAHAVYEAVALQKPFYERPATVGGECVIEPRNLWLPLGISAEDAIKACRGLMREPKAVLFGGPMLGKALPSLDMPVTAGVRAVLALSKESVSVPPAEACIHCGRCVEACPVDISPAMITLAAENGLYEETRDWGVDYCIDCGNCTYVCPAKRPMQDLIGLARLGLMAREQDVAAVPEQTGEGVYEEAQKE